MPKNYISPDSNFYSGENSILFTVRFSNVDTGLSDMLIRLSTMYKVGKALSYTYVHTPFICRRSSPLSYSDRILKKLIGDRIYNYTNRFLGFDQYDLKANDKRFSNYRIIDIDLEEMIASGVADIVELRDKIVNTIKANRSFHPILLSFLTTDNFYRYETRSKVETLLQKTDVDDGDFRDLVTQNYWEARRSFPVSIPFDQEKIKLLIHIRRGDRAWIQLDNKLICLHGKEIAIVNTIESITGNPEKFPRKKFQRPVEISEIAAFLNIIRSRYGSDNFSTIIISDGYDKAFAEIRAAITAGKIALSPDETKQLNQVQTAYNQELADLANDPSISLILGESKRNFFHSFHALASADIVIKTSGGFASVIHRFFKQTDQPPLVFDAAQLSDPKKLEQFLEQVGAVIESRTPNLIQTL